MFMKTLETLLNVYGPSGNEWKVSETIRKILSGSVENANTDIMGNLIVEKKGKKNGKTIMISAHMDQIGFVVTAIEKEGFLRVSGVGGVSIDMSRTRHVIFENGAEGVLCCQPTKEGKPDMDQMFVDIGADNDLDARKYVKPGDMCVYAPEIIKLGNHRLAAPAMDDRCACALLCELLIQVPEPENTIIALFSTQEEVGLRGSTVGAYAVNPDIGIGLDVTGWGDTPEVKYPDIKLGKGAAIKFMDRSMIATPSVRDALISAAEESNVPYQREILPYGGTDGAAIQHSRGGIPAGTLSIPCRYIHSACEVIDMRDMESALSILKSFVNMDF